MTITSMTRAGTLAIVLAASALVGCSSPSGMVATRTNVAMAPAASSITGPYSGTDYAAALNAAMTSDYGGE